MGITETPAVFTACCDGCGLSVPQTTRSRPNHWSDFHLLRYAYDWQGAPCAAASIKRLLCADCSQLAAEAINNALLSRRALLTPEGEAK